MKRILLFVFLLLWAQPSYAQFIFVSPGVWWYSAPPGSTFSFTSQTTGGGLSITLWSSGRLNAERVYAVTDYNGNILGYTNSLDYARLQIAQLEAEVRKSLQANRALNEILGTVIEGCAANEGGIVVINVDRCRELRRSRGSRRDGSGQPGVCVGCGPSKFTLPFSLVSFNPGASAALLQGIAERLLPVAVEAALIETGGPLLRVFLRIPGASALLARLGTHFGRLYDRVAGIVRTFIPRRGGALGDLTEAEVRQIQGVVNQAGRPLEVVGSAARGTRRGIGRDLPIGKGPGTRSDIDFLVPPSSRSYFTGLDRQLPSLDPRSGIIPGTHNPYVGPAIRFEPGVDPFLVPGVSP